MAESYIVNSQKQLVDITALRLFLVGVQLSLFCSSPLPVQPEKEPNIISNGDIYFFTHSTMTVVI